MTPPRPSRRRRPAFAVIEAVLSALIVGLMLAAAMETVSKSRASQAWSVNRVRAFDLASRLMSEITDLRYADPDIATVVLGPEAAELITGRAIFDDVDDYVNLSDAPPKDGDGAPIPGYSGWSRSVHVAWASSADLRQDSISESGVKRITVRVSKDGRKLAELVSLRTLAVDR